jgi:MATE family multidrug resistance protein
MVAQDLGRRRHAVREPRRTIRQGLWVALALGLPAMLLLWNIAPLLHLLRQDPELIPGAEAYVHAAMWGFVPGLWFVVLRNFIASLERPRAGMVIMLIGVSFNAIAAYGLIFGRLGLPALGLWGAGLAAALSNVFLFVSLLGFILIDRQFRRFHVLGHLWRADWARFREIFRIGLPIGLTLVMEVGLFASAGFLMGLIGTAELAAHQIALQCASVTFMVPLGLAQAATVRVGLAAGAGQAEGVRRAGVTALLMGGLFMLAMATVMWMAPGAIVGLFIDADAPANAAVIRAAVLFLAIAALFQIFDGGQVIGAGALRGLKDTRWPMAFAAVAYWGVGMSLAVGLGFGVGWGGLGIWIGLAAALAVAALLMVARFIALQRRLAATAPASLHTADAMV